MTKPVSEATKPVSKATKKAFFVFTLMSKTSKKGFFSPYLIRETPKTAFFDPKLNSRSPQKDFFVESKTFLATEKTDEAAELRDQMFGKAACVTRRGVSAPTRTC